MIIDSGCNTSWIVRSIETWPTSTTIEFMHRTKLQKNETELFETSERRSSTNLNAGVLQTTQVYKPEDLLLFNGLENGGSVP